MSLHVQSILQSSEPAVIVVKLQKTEQVMQVGKDLIISKEVQDMLICDRKILLLIALLILYDEVVEEDFVQFVEILLYGDPYPLFCGLFIVMEVELLPVLLLDDCP